MTRKGLALTLAIVMVWAVALPAFSQGNPFRDVPLDHWAYDAVSALWAAGLIEGYPDGTFGGERTFTRYEMAMVFARILARFEELLQEEIAATVDDKIADLAAAIAALSDHVGLPGAPGAPGAPGQPGAPGAPGEPGAGQAPIVIERVVREDGTVESTVSLSPELEDAIRAIVAEKLREELAQLPPEVIAHLGDDHGALRELVDARTDELAGYILDLSSEFSAELELLGVRVAELERLFVTLDSRITAVEQQVKEARSAAETARGIADAAQAAAQAAAEAAQEAGARAEAAWQLVESLRTQGVTEAELIEATGLAGSAQEAADSAADRAYRARLAAERAAALAADAQEAAQRAGAIAQIAHTDAQAALQAAQEAHELAANAMAEAARQGEEARTQALQAMERAQRADQQAYRAKLTADRALARVDELQAAMDQVQADVGALEGKVDELQRRPVLGGELRADYELTRTTDEKEWKLDPRDKSKKPDTIKPADVFRTTVGVTASFSPAEGVDVEGGIRFRASVFGPSTHDDVNLTDLHLKVTTPGVLRMAYFGSLTGAQVAEGFNKYTLDPKTYEAKVESGQRGGAILDSQLGSVNVRFIGSRYPKALDNDHNLYGMTVGMPLADGLNLRLNYLWWSEEDRSASVQAYGESGGLEYDWIYALYKQSPAVDGRINTAIGDLKLGFKYGVVDQAYAPNAADPDKPKPEELDHFGKLLDEDDGDLLPDQRRYVADAELPVGFLTAIAEKGRHDKDMSAAATFTDWSMFGFKDLGLLGFNIGARSYSDTRDGDRQTQALRVDVSREFQLGLPLTFTVTHASAQLTNWTLGWTNKNHLGVGVAVKDYPLSDALTLNASVKTERNPIKDDKWTEPGNWNPTFKDDNDPATEYRIFNRDTVSGSVKFQATEALSFNAGYTLERRDTTDDGERDASVSTTTVGADYTLRLGATAVTLGYGYEVRNAEGFFYNGSPKSTYSLGIQRELLGATLNASYKVVVGRGSDDKEKVNATDTVAQLDLTYPIADSFEFNLSGRWGQSVGNTPGSDDHEDYEYHSVKAGLGIKF